jgi:plastocyanin
MDINRIAVAVQVFWVLAAAACGEPSREIEPAKSTPHRLVVRMLDDMTFEPAQATIQAGDTVVWINSGSLPHTTTGDPDRAMKPGNVTLPVGAGPWDSGTLPEGAEYEVVFTVPGRYAYVCSLHEMAGMVGSIDVRP